MTSEVMSEVMRVLDVCSLRFRRQEYSSLYMCVCHRSMSHSPVGNTTTWQPFHRHLIQVKQLEMTVNKTKRGHDKVLGPGGEGKNEDQRFKTSIGTFLAAARRVAEATATDFGEIERAYVKTVVYITCDDEKKAAKVECDEFFGLLADFTEELQRSVEKVMDDRAKAARDAGRAAGGPKKYFKGRHKVRAWGGAVGRVFVCLCVCVLCVLSVLT